MEPGLGMPQGSSAVDISDTRLSSMPTRRRSNIGEEPWIASVVASYSDDRAVFKDRVDSDPRLHESPRHVDGHAVQRHPPCFSSLCVSIQLCTLIPHY